MEKGTVFDFIYKSKLIGADGNIIRPNVRELYSNKIKEAIRKGEFDIIADFPQRVVRFHKLFPTYSINEGMYSLCMPVSINEGIIINPRTMEVSYDPSNEDFVNTSIEYNPREQEGDYGKGVKVYSLLSRNKGRSKGISSDGNPVIYAFKKEKGWEFRTNNDERLIVGQMTAIMRKFIMMHSMDIVIVIPSANGLNIRLGEMFGTVYKDVYGKEITILYENVFRKATVGEIYYTVCRKDSLFRKRFGNRFTEACDRLRDYLDLMINTDDPDEAENSPYRSHIITDQEIRNAVTDTIKANPDKVPFYNPYIDDKDVLFIDDTIRKGQTIRDAVKELRAYYNPRSINVLTMFSRL